MKKWLTITTFVLCTLAVPAAANRIVTDAWKWNRNLVKRIAQDATNVLTDNSGAHAVAMFDYWNPDINWYSFWTTVVYSKVQTGQATQARGVEFRTLEDENFFNLQITDEYNPRFLCTATNGSYLNPQDMECYTHAAWLECEGTFPHARAARRYARGDGTYYWGAYDDITNLLVRPGGLEPRVAVARFTGADEKRVCAATGVSYVDNDLEYWGLECGLSTNAGQSWYDEDIIVPEEDRSPVFGVSVAVGPNTGEAIYVAYEDEEESGVYFQKSVNFGEDWLAEPLLISDNYTEYAANPCIAALGNLLFVCWRDETEPATLIRYRWSTNGGTDWIPALTSDPPYGPFDPRFACAEPCASMVTCSDKPTVVMTCEQTFGTQTHLTTAVGRFWANEWHWFSEVFENAWGDADLNPNSVAADPHPDHAGGQPRGSCVWSVPYGGTRRIYRYSGGWVPLTYLTLRPPDPANSFRALAPDATGMLRFTNSSCPSVNSGYVSDGSLVSFATDIGCLPALALDGNGDRWNAYLRSDTLWCAFDGGWAYKPVFCGSSSARPGQPSIECYPGSATAALTFPIYDSAGASSMILWAKFSSTNLMLDTIESVANLSDSCPSVTVVYGETLVVCWQHGDSILSSKLLDYGPGDWNRPPAWSSLELVTANGYHPMTRVEGEDVVHCLWTEKIDVTGIYDTFNICHATCDLDPTGMFHGWTAGTNPSTGNQDTTEKGNAVYAGCGVSVWQEKVSGVWNLYARVRDSIKTLVANDTDAYHPHAVACSSATNPSTNEIRVSLLYTSAEVFAVDSGLFDTGDVRFRADTFSVSNAMANATRSSNGAKLIRPQGSDSLHATYCDLSGGLYCASTPNGDSWQRDVVTGGADYEYPAIAQDSTGMRWIVALTRNLASCFVRRFYLGDSAWSGGLDVFTADDPDAISNVSLAAVSDTTTPRAYAAFVVQVDENQRQLLLAKFDDGGEFDVDTVAEGEDLCDPCLSVEAYQQDWDRVHLVWQSGGVVKYSMLTDSRNGALETNWEQAISLSGSSNSDLHPVIAADRDQVVAAWTHNGADIHVCHRSTADDYDDWESAQNLTDSTSDTCDYATVSVGEQVVVAWEQTESSTDHDIMLSVNYGEPLSVADDTTMATCPHVVYQQKTVGQSTVNIAHVVNGAEPEDDYYEVAYKQCDLDEMGGQQAARTTPVRIEPELFPAQPNPFNRATTIRYQTGQAGNVLLRVFDASGRVVRTLDNGSRKPGRYTATWDGTDARGRRVANGIYFYRLDLPAFRSVKKAVLMR